MVTSVQQLVRMALRMRVCWRPKGSDRAVLPAGARRRGLNLPVFQIISTKSTSASGARRFGACWRCGGKKACIAFINNLLYD